MDSISNEVDINNLTRRTYCNGKLIYDKRTAITAKNKRYHEDHMELRIYQCEYGDHWHLTKQVRGRRNKYEKRKKESRKTYNLY